MSSQAIIIVFQLIILLFSVIIHEVSHGFVAYLLGDKTAKDAGRLTLNPLSHLDLFGSIIIPLSLFVFSGGSFVFGWAKPVPYNPYNLSHPKRDSGLVALAGPISNFLLAIGGGLCIWAVHALGSTLIDVNLLYMVMLINVSLAIFNLVPIPPLDGSKILFALLPDRWGSFMEAFERYGVMILILFIFFGFQLITPIIFSMFTVLANFFG